MIKKITYQEFVTEVRFNTALNEERGSEGKWEDACIEVTLPIGDRDNDIYVVDACKDYCKERGIEFIEDSEEWENLGA